MVFQRLKFEMRYSGVELVHRAGVEFGDIVESVALNILAAGVDILAFVRGQVLQQGLTECAEETFERRFVGRLVRNRWLHYEPESRTRTDHVRRKILPAMVDHDRLRDECRLPADTSLAKPRLGSHIR